MGSSGWYRSDSQLISEPIYFCTELKCDVASCRFESPELYMFFPSG